MDYEVLIVDDEKNMRNSIARVLKHSGYSVRMADSGETAIGQIKQSQPDLVLLDMALPKMDGLETLRQIKNISKQVVVIIITAYGSVENAVSAMKLGSYDFIRKPFNIDFLRMVVEKALENKQLKKEIEKLRAEFRERYKINYIIGTSQKIRDVYNIIEKLAPAANANILVEGESGTGKELVAYTIHQRSTRSKEPFLPINCGAIPKELLETELFGYEKGAFTDASKEGKKGIFEQAGDGTIFLDEIGALDLSLQVKLLRVIEARKFYRVGGLEEISLKARIVAATNKDLKQALRDNLFRADLYFRINVVNIHVPPLRERNEDVMPLAKSFIEEFNSEFNKNFRTISPEAEKILKFYDWPGNIRELRNLMERIVLLENGEIVSKEHLPKEMYMTEIVSPAINIPAKGIFWFDVEKGYIRKALEISGGNQLKAAKLLGIQRGVLRYRIKKYKIVAV